MIENIPTRNEGQPYHYRAFPAWCSGPDGQSDVFNSEGEVPPGWTMPDGKVKPGKAVAAAPVAVPVDAPATDTPGDAPEVDASGAVWDPALHAATKGKTGAGLWRMKVGVSRPASAPALDL